jgi:hypothetical protein
LEPLSLEGKVVNAVTGVAREVLDKYFEWNLVDDEGNPVMAVTPLTGFSSKGSETEAEVETAVTPLTGFPARESGEETVTEKLDAARVGELARWWCMRIRELPDADQVRKELRDGLANEVAESALDTEADRVVKVADMNLEEILRNAH